MNRPSTTLLLALLVALVVVAILFGAAVGSVAISPLALGGMTLDRLGLAHVPATWSPQDEAIFFDLRLPRVAGAALVGLALATAGALFQGLLRNPLADPYVIGTSGGASLGAVVAMLLTSSFQVLGFGLVPIAAFLGAVGSMALIYRLARVGGKAPVVTLLLAGFAVSVILTYSVSLLLIVDDRFQLNLPRVYTWLLGGVSVTVWSQLGVVGPIILFGTLVAAGLGQSLNALSLGEEMAERLGIEVEREKLIIIVVGCLLTASAVTISGLIGFVGLIVPHVIRLRCGPDHRLLIPASALLGATFLVATDLVARTILSPAELPVGIITAFIGGPFFLYLLRTQPREYRL